MFSDIYLLEDAECEWVLHKLGDMVLIKIILACDPLPIYFISFGRFVETPNPRQKTNKMMDDGCSHGVISQLLEVHGSVLNKCRRLPPRCVPRSYEITRVRATK